MDPSTLNSRSDSVFSFSSTTLQSARRATGTLENISFVFVPIKAYILFIDLFIYFSKYYFIACRPRLNNFLSASFCLLLSLSISSCFLVLLGSVAYAIDRVMSGRNRNAFCVVRPPGHHAGTLHSQSFMWCDTVMITNHYCEGINNNRD